MPEKENLLKLYHCMLKIRLVEQKIAEIYPTDKIQSPVHLCTGQEAVNAGVCLALKTSDHLYGTYRSHGVFIAKGGDLKSLFAELYGKETGCCRGKGGSMHLVAPEVGLMACAAIVASTIPVATGDALASQMQGRKRVVVAFFGDGAVDEGVFFESVNFAVLKNLPILFVCENNHYAIHSKIPDRRKQTEIHRIAEGLGIQGKCFDGNDAGIVYSTTLQAVEEIRAGGPPVILEYKTYRWNEHVGPALDHHEAYRDPGKTAWAKGHDPLDQTRSVLEKDFKVSISTFNEMKEAVEAEIEEAIEFAEKSPFPTSEQLYQDTFAVPSAVSSSPTSSVSSRHDFKPGSSTLDPRLKSCGDDTSNKGSKLIPYGQAINDALTAAMEKDPSVFVMGLGVDDHRAIFGSTKNLVQRFGKERVFDTPISEAGMTGVAIGAALAGMKPVHIHIRVDFLYLAMDQICNTAAKWHAMFGGKMKVPMVIRAVIGKSWGQGAQHSQNLASLFMHIPGLKVIMPTTAYEAKGMLLSAINDPNPVIMIEHRLLYDIRDEVPENDYEVPLGQAQIRRPGNDITLVANSYMAVECLKAAEYLSSFGIEAEIVDPVSLVPLDENTILNSVRKTGRLLVVDSGWMTCGISAEIAALAAEKAFDALTAPVQRMGFAQATCPVSKPLEDEFYPNAKKIAGRVFQILNREVPEEEVPLLTSKFKGPF